MAKSERIAGTWSRVDAVAASRDALFVIEDAILYRLAPSGDHIALTNRWHPRAMAALGDALYIFDGNDSLYRASQADGSYVPLTSAWRDVRAATTSRDSLYVATGSAIYAVDPATGAETQLPQRWDVKHLVGLGTFLFVFETCGTLRRLDTRDGLYTTLPGNWPRAAAVAATQDAVFVVDDTVLYRIDPRTGETTRVDNRFLTTRLVAVGGHLMSFEETGLYRVTL